ncbi:hypothetical protein QWY85_05015 [Neolewinella lacunae]|uniref:Uncharacterized protein n=1 Tax=Neolewinella lacunae TaxID=1517758 RepID=A0A923PL48_9BACT|nr:hypothetical protein [Neolewinella lacunae]MBC6996158.1 hypothetical protein [Neolewinella lacunae]MDN3634009.1 hypothetical protein [Neolewinella lacunae]
MKLTEFFISILFSCCLVSPLQAQTSQEEYLYVVYGYKEQLAKGLDNKDGYTWESLYQYDFSYQQAKLLGKETKKGRFLFSVLRKKDTNEYRATVVIFLDESNRMQSEGMFWCIPHPKSTSALKEQSHEYLATELKLPPEILLGYAQALEGFLAQSTK